MTTKPTSITEQLSAERRRVDFDSYDITVQQLVSMVAERQIDIAPIYQRRFRWDAIRQSELVESIFLGIPVPNLFMATNTNGTWEVVDGVQRLSTLVHYCGSEMSRNILGVGDPLVISGLKKLTALNGTAFAEQAQSVALTFNLRPIKVTTLSDKSDTTVRFDLFERLNRGGVQLTDQEIRGCIYRGPFNQFLDQLSSDESFANVIHLRKSAKDDGTCEEYVLRFFAFYHKYKKFEHSVVDFLNSYMEEASTRFDYSANKTLFERTFAELARLFPDGIRKRQKLTPVNLFEAIAVGAALALTKRTTLLGQDLSWIGSEDFRLLTTGATNTPRMVTGRIEFAARHFGW